LRTTDLEKETAMPPDNLHRLATWPRLLAPVDARIAPLFCLLLLTVSWGLASFAFACATPFAAFAAFAGAILPLSAALPVVVAARIVNQAIGFGVLGYPVELNTFVWGFAIGAALQADGQTRSVCTASSIRRRSAAWTILRDWTYRSRTRASALWMTVAGSFEK
jgi:hypothetical protein